MRWIDLSVTCGGLTSLQMLLHKALLLNTKGGPENPSAYKPPLARLAERIQDLPNSCEAAWEIINSSNGRSSGKSKHTLSPGDNASLSSVRTARESIPSSIPFSNQLLHNQDVPSLRFAWNPSRIVKFMDVFWQ
ncbi:hypothetical protein J6590_030898 [Homalodisca vitripennis]|nr:hypothetical protein J6590_030898 [Homalodisca vitripennis]